MPFALSWGTGKSRQLSEVERQKIQQWTAAHGSPQQVADTPVAAGFLGLLKNLRRSDTRLARPQPPRLPKVYCFWRIENFISFHINLYTLSVG